MPAPAYCPDAGDIIKLNFDPVKANEQAGWRPAIVISVRAFNYLTGRCAACPITRTVRRWPFEVPVPAGIGLAEGAIQVDQLRVLSWRARGAQYFASVPAEVLEDVREKLAAMLGID